MKILIIGGAGFIGTNAADYHLNRGDKVVIFDNFSRYGTLINLQMIENKYKQNLSVIQGDIRIDRQKLVEAVSDVDRVYLVAAQVAVTTSVTNPREDFEINALGTFNVLEAIRESDNNPILLFTSTNKVYGGLEHLDVEEKDGRYEYKDLHSGVNEDMPLDFHSPYGCSKGTADQYVRDYSRIFGLKTIVFRQSCIYGINQFGIEDQGWIAHFTISNIYDRPLTIYGDGKQVRDTLYVTDLVEAFNAACEKIDVTNGQIYNIGGGPKNTMSLLELIGYLEKYSGKKLNCSYSDWRPGDQPVFVCDISKAKKDFGWEPKTDVATGIKILSDWVKENKEVFQNLYTS